MPEQWRILVGVYYRPAQAFGQVLDSGSLAFAAVLAIVIAAVLGVLTNLVPVALLFAPFAVIVIAQWAGRGSAIVALERDYAPMLACALFAWAASHAPALIVEFAAPQLLQVVHMICLAYFLGLMVIAVGVVGGATYAQATGTVVVSAAIALAGWFGWDYLGGLPHLFLSPILLILLYPAIRSYFDGFTGGLRSRQSFRRNLEAATLNPHDSDAQYQLGLIYQERRNYTEAIARFSKASEIDASDPAPLFQLGRIAREQDRFDDALRFLNQAATLDPKHSSHEVWRELGATNFALGHHDLARQQLEHYTRLREYDPMGLYWLGRAYKTLNRSAEAKTAFERAVEAANTAPRHLHRQVAKWIGLSRSELRSL